jgi:hypothetical protein
MHQSSIKEKKSFGKLGASHTRYDTVFLGWFSRLSDTTSSLRIATRPALCHNTQQADLLKTLGYLASWATKLICNV